MPSKSCFLKSEVSCQYISISTDRKTCDILSNQPNFGLSFILVGFKSNLGAFKKTYRPNYDLLGLVYTSAKMKVTNLSHTRFGVSQEEKQEYLDKSYQTILNSH